MRLWARNFGKRLPPSFDLEIVNGIALQLFQAACG
jgi:hypothetical protein